MRHTQQSIIKGDDDADQDCVRGQSATTAMINNDIAEMGKTTTWC
jgi:hypothetical protein